MKIAILDADAVNPGDIDWGILTNIAPPASIYHSTSPDEVVAHIGDAEYIFVNRVPITRETIEQAPNLKWIGVFATGYNMIDTAAARENNIVVSNVPAYSTSAVVQMTFALILELCQHTGSYDTAVHIGSWQKLRENAMWMYNLTELSGKTLGIVGFGAIGSAVAKVAQAFGMNILVYNRTVKPEFESKSLKFVALPELMSCSDIVTLHLPLCDATKGLISAELISTMKKGAMLINTARGAIVDESALAFALNTSSLSGAAVDVVSREPIEADNPLLTAKNCIITPHIAWAPLDTRKRLFDISAQNLRAFINGTPQNVVS